jgi:cytochrome b6-f complex iron-sulfur subunit
MTDEAEVRTRRNVLMYGAAALAAAAGLGSYVSLEFVTPWARDRSRGAVIVGYPEEIPVGSVMVVGAARAFVGRTEDGFFALSTVCPHLGCVLRWLPDERRFHCPCHGSQFELDGRVLNGPARSDLRALELGTDDLGRLLVDGGAP